MAGKLNTRSFSSYKRTYLFHVFRDLFAFFFSTLAYYILSYSICGNKEHPAKLCERS